MAREEVLAGPLELWIAPRAEPFPDPDETPGGNWERIGASGTENYTDDGVSVSLPQTIEEFIPAGATMAIKAFRTEESVEITVNVADARIETWKLALNDNDETAATGTREISLYRGGKVHHFALLARGQSPYEDDGHGQFQVPACYMSAEPEFEGVKGTPGALELTFRSVLPEADAINEVVFSGEYSPACGFVAPSSDLATDANHGLQIDGLLGIAAVLHEAVCKVGHAASVLDCLIFL
jgi:hypothetical protein